MDISVIICVYNPSEVKLYEALESVKRQSAKNFELIIVNDGSDEETCEFLLRYFRDWDDYRSDIPFKNVFTGEMYENKGLAYARNIGIANAKGEFVYFLDADDIIHDKCLEYLWTVYSKYEDKDKVDVVIGNVKRGYNNSQAQKYFTEVRQMGMLSVKSFTKYDALRQISSYNSQNDLLFNSTWNKLWRKWLFNNVKYLVGHPHEDNYTQHEVYWQIRKGLCLSKVTYFYRYGGNFADSNLYKDDEILTANLVRENFYKSLYNSDNENVKNEIKDIYKSQIIRVLYTYLMYYNVVKRTEIIIKAYKHMKKYEDILGDSINNDICTMISKIYSVKGVKE